MHGSDGGRSTRDFGVQTDMQHTECRRRIVWRDSTDCGREVKGERECGSGGEATVKKGFGRFGKR